LPPPSGFVAVIRGGKRSISLMNAERNIKRQNLAAAGLLEVGVEKLRGPANPRRDFR
jgi:hypothetical protein